MRNFTASEINIFLNQMDIGIQNDYANSNTSEIAYARYLQNILLENKKRLYEKYKISAETFFYLLLSSNAKNFYGEFLRIYDKQRQDNNDCADGQDFSIFIAMYYQLKEKQLEASNRTESIKAVDFIDNHIQHTTNSYTEEFTSDDETVKWTVTFDKTAEGNIIYPPPAATLQKFEYKQKQQPNQAQEKIIAQKVAFTTTYRLLSSVYCANTIIDVQNIATAINNTALLTQVLIYCEIMCNLYGAEFNLDDITQEHEQQQIREKAAEKQNIKDFVNFIEKNYKVAQLAPLFKDVRDFYDHLAKVEVENLTNDNLQQIQERYAAIEHMLGEDRNKEIKQRLDNLLQQQQKHDSATAIQARFRMHQVRQKLKKQHEAATAIQACLRGHQVRQELKKQHDAATAIQAGFRMNQERKNLQKIKQAATAIQAGLRGHQVRQKLKKQHDAATAIQVGLRGHQARTTLKQLKGLAKIFYASRPISIEPNKHGRLIAIPNPGAIFSPMYKFQGINVKSIAAVEARLKELKTELNGDKKNIKTVMAEQEIPLYEDLNKKIAACIQAMTHVKILPKLNSLWLESLQAIIKHLTREKSGLPKDIKDDLMDKAKVTEVTEAINRRLL